LGLEVGLELEGDNFERDSVGRERLWLGSDCLEKRAHVASTIVCTVFMDKRCCCWYCFIKSEAWTWVAGSHILSLSGYPSHLTKYWSSFPRPIFRCPMICSTWYSSSPSTNSGGGREKFGPWAVVSR
jgi:hypothetical protein